MWIYLGLLSAFFLGLYNIFKKVSVQDNAVLPVLWLTTVFGFIGLLPIMAGVKLYPALMARAGITIQSLSIADHIAIAIKSFIMTISWSLAFYGLKHLPITIVSPIRSASPFFTLLGAVLIFHEQPSVLQWAGFACIIGSMLLYSKLGKLEGIHFLQNKWVYFIFIGTLLGASSGLYDKYLIQHCKYSAPTVQFWFSAYLVLFLGALVLMVWVPNRTAMGQFHWRWSIPLVGLFLVAADFFYFRALQIEGTLLVLLSAIKRSQIFITVFVGGAIFHEKNKRKKIIPMLGVLLGVGLILYAK